MLDAIRLGFNVTNVIAAVVGYLAIVLFLGRLASPKWHPDGGRGVHRMTLEQVKAVERPATEPVQGYWSAWNE